MDNSNEVENEAPEVKETPEGLISSVASSGNSATDATEDNGEERADDPNVILDAKDEELPGDIGVKDELTKRVFAPAKKRPRTRRTYRRKPKPETVEERFERICKRAEPPSHRRLRTLPQDAEEVARRTKRTLLQQREHCRRRGISHPLWDEDYNKGGES